MSNIVSSALQRQAERTWQILSIEENVRSPGYFNLWVASEGQMSKISLRVERSIIVNSRVIIYFTFEIYLDFAGCQARTRGYSSNPSPSTTSTLPL